MSRNGLTREENRRAWLLAALIVAALLGLVFFALRSTERETETGGTAPALPATSTLVTQAAGDLDDIEIDAVFDPEARTLTVCQSLRLENRWGEPISEVVLRSWSGAYLRESTSPAASEELYASCYPQGFSPGGAALESVEVNGTEASFSWLDEAQTVLSLSLDSPWQAEKTLHVSLAYTVEIPVCASRFGETDGIWALGNVFLIPAVREGGAWRADAYVSVGDPFLSDCANWTVRLTLPRGYTAAASGWGETAEGEDGSIVTFRSEAVRDFALVISNAFQSAQGMAGNALVTCYARNASRAAEMLTYTCQALETFAAHYGDYVYPSLTLAEVDFPFGGMEYPRMVMLGSSLTEAGGESLEWAVAHEVAHQWWYAMVGSDSWYQAWQDESLCEYALLDYVGAWYGESAWEDFRVQRIESALRAQTALSITPGSPLDYFSNLEEYTLVCYRRGAALWTALETALSKDGLDSFLQRYAETYRFRRATRSDLTELLEEVSGQDWSALITDYLDTVSN